MDDAGRRRRHVPAGVPLFVLFSSLQFVVMESFLDFPFPYMGLRPFLVSCLFFCSVNAALSALFGDIRPAFALTGAVSVLEGAASRYLVRFRGVPLFLSDLRSAGTAAGVAGWYDLSPDPQMCVMASAGVAVAAVVVAGHGQFLGVDGWFRGLGARGRVVSALACSALAAGIALFAANDYAGMRGDYRPGQMSLNYGASSRRQVGTLYDMAGTAWMGRLSAPEGYAGWHAPGDVFEPEDVPAAAMPDVVVIMNESFSDPALYGDPCALSEYMPFIRSLGGDGRSASGILDVSVIAGNTANTEFEYLTGASMALYTPHSVPYQYAFRRDVPSLARYMRDMGYETWAVHPGPGSSWNRAGVYGAMGFDRMLFSDAPCGGVSFPDLSGRVDPVTGDTISMPDDELYGTVMDILGLRKEDGVPRFVFVVTLQNHGGYFRRFDGLELDVGVDAAAAGAGADGGLAMATYLSLMKKSDGAYHRLCDGLDARLGRDGFDALTVFFGDHLPGDTVRPLFAAAGGRDPYDMSDPAFYAVPYAMRATYRLDGFSDLGRCSACYAGADLFRALGRGMPGHYAFLDGMRARVPVLTGVRMESDGSPEADSVLREYRMRTWFRMSDPGGWEAAGR